MKKGRRMPYQKGVVRFEHMAPMRKYELEKILFMLMNYAESDIAFIHGGMVSNVDNAWEHRLVELGLVIRRYNAHGSHNGKHRIGAHRLIEPHRLWFLRNIGALKGRKRLDERQYPKRIS